MDAMAFNPESAMVPEAEIISAETQTEASQVSAEDPESSRITSPVASDVWRQRGEELAPAILDFESRPEPGWREWNEPVQSASAGEMPEQVSDIRLMPDIELVQARKAWLQPLLTQLRENYKTICQNGALVAVGAVAALLVVSFAHRRSPLPAGLQGAEKVGQEVPLSKPQLTKARRKRMAQAVDRHHLAKSQVTAKMAAEVKSLVPSSRAKVAIGKVSLASSQQRLSSPHSKSSSETDFVAKDTVTHDGNGAVGRAPK